MSIVRGLQIGHKEVGRTVEFRRFRAAAAHAERHPQRDGERDSRRVVAARKEVRMDVRQLAVDPRVPALAWYQVELQVQERDPRGAE